MNEQFVSIKVDREERPDLDAIYMDAVVALTGHGGWPMTVFLTPEGEPFFGGTYYPPAPRHGLPSFRQVLDAVARAYRERREDVAENARRLVEAVRSSSEVAPSSEPLTDSILSEAARGLRRAFDPEHGGFGGAPKFPPASALEFLLRRGELDLVTATLDAMAAGGMYDLVGGGFHRYSVDADWLVPHFEKMLYDNALLVPAYLHAWVVTGEERYRAVAEETFEYLLRDLAAARGRLRVVAGRRHRGRRGADVHLDGGRGRPGRAAAAVRARPLDHPRRARRRSCGRACSRSARAARSPAATTRRSPPGTGWRSPRSRRRGAGCQVTLCYERQRSSETSCSAQLSAPRRAALPDLAERAGERSPATSRTTPTSRTASTSCTSRRASCAGSRRRTGSRGSRSTSSPTSEHGGFFMTARDAEELVARKKDLDDNPVPSGNSMLAFVLLRLARIYGDDELERRAAGVLRLLHTNLSRIPSAFGWALCALDLYLSPPRELAIVGSPEDEVARARARAVRPERGRRLRPGRDVPLSRARPASTGSRRSTCASGSPAGRR